MLQLSLKFKHFVHNYEKANFITSESYRSFTTILNFLKFINVYSLCFNKIFLS